MDAERQVVYDLVRLFERHTETIEYLPLQCYAVSVQVRCRNRQQYFFLLNAAEQFFRMHNLLEKMDLRSDEIRMQYLGAK